METDWSIIENEWRTTNKDNNGDERRGEEMRTSWEEQNTIVARSLSVCKSIKLPTRVGCGSNA